MSKKIEKQELESLQEKVNKINSLQVQIGGLEAQKHELLHLSLIHISEPTRPY